MDNPSKDSTGRYDGDGHGTHVAGTIAAQDNGFGVVGVSPDASLYIYKIFGDDGLWVNGPKTTASNLIFAADTCAENGANIISMSLGGARPTKLEERAFEGYYAAGILSVAAAGNDNEPADPTTWGVLHYPASYPSVVSVAAVDENGVVADFSQRNDTLELSAPGVGVWSTISYIEANLVLVDGVNYVANHIEYTPYGTTSGILFDGGKCLTTGAWDGLVVLCERGDATFADKVINVENSGGVAAVIYNNESGNFLGTMGEDGLTGIIAVSLSQEDGQVLVANKIGQNASVDSQIEQPASGYEPWGGTSMATPHVSAVAALLWDYCPSATNEEIRQAMKNSALDLGATGFDTDYGYGLVQAYEAMELLNCGSSGDLTPPVISNVNAALKGKSKWTITYATDELAQCTVTLASTDYPEIGFLLIHELTVKTSETLVFSIICEDKAGNESDQYFYP